jgi:hypothetical protein
VEFTKWNRRCFYGGILLNGLTIFLYLQNTNFLGEITPAYIWIKPYGNGIHYMKKEKVAKHLRIISLFFWYEIDGWYFFIAFIYPDVVTRSLTGLQIQGTIIELNASTMLWYYWFLFLMKIEFIFILHKWAKVDTYEITSKSRHYGRVLHSSTTQSS